MYEPYVTSLRLHTVVTSFRLLSAGLVQLSNYRYMVHLVGCICSSTQVHVIKLGSPCSVVKEKGLIWADIAPIECMQFKYFLINDWSAFISL